MQLVLDTPVSIGLNLSRTEVHLVARRYVDTYIDPTFAVTSDAPANQQTINRGVWRFFVCCDHGPLCALEVDIQSGKVIPFSSAEIRVIREKAAIYTARKQGVLPVDERGYVLGEYARRRASRYLDDHISMYYNAADPVFVSTPAPTWQVTIVFKRYQLGPFTLGVMDVDATSGEPVPLSTKQIEQIRERTRAIIRHQTSATEAG